MAPSKKIKTYKNPKKPKPLTKSGTEINDILINLTNLGISLHTSSHALRETTFDRLLKGQNYNDVVLVKYPKNHFSSSGELSYSIVECTKKVSRDDIGRSNSNNIKPVACESYVYFSHKSDQDIQTDASLNEPIFKSRVDRSSIITRSKSKLLQSSSIQSDTEFSQAKQNTSSQCVQQETNRSTSILSISSTQNESELSNTNKHILKQSHSILKDKLFETKKFQNHCYLNISGFKFECLRNKCSTPVISNLVTIRRRKGKKNKFETLSIVNSNLNTSIESNTRRLPEEDQLSSMTCSSLQKNEHSNIITSTPLHKSKKRDDIGRSDSNNIKPVACESYVSFSHKSEQDVQTDASLNIDSIVRSPVITRSKFKLKNAKQNTSQSVSNLQETEDELLSNSKLTEKYVSLTGKQLRRSIIKKNTMDSSRNQGDSNSLENNGESCDFVDTSITAQQSLIKNSILNTSIEGNTKRLVAENNSSVNISYPTPVKTIERNKIIQDQLSSMTCSALQKNESTKSEHSNIVNNQQNYTSLQNSNLSNSYLVLTGTPFHRSKSISELIDISSENETEFSVSKPTSHFNSNKSQLALNNLPNEVKNFTESELPNCSFLHVENDNNKQNKSSCSDKISKNKTRNLKHSEDELQTESQYENNVLIEDKYVNRSNIDQIEMGTCSKQEINSNSLENNSEDYDFVDTSITAQQPLMKKYVSLAAGKKFRRSIIIHNKNSMDSSRKLKGDDSSDSTKYPKHKRRTIKVVPITTMKARMSELKNYAANFLVQEEGIEDNSSVNFNLTNHMKQSIIPTSARNIVLQRCMQTEPLNFDNCYPPSVLQHCQKIGEGVYGEVFMYRDESSSHNVMKVIPIEGDQIVNSEKQKTFEEIISEIIISAELCHLREDKFNKTDAFTEVKKIRCVKGRYPHRLLELWNLYDEVKHSENDSPEIFQCDQLYIVLELSNGGRDLEAFEFKNAQQSLAVFHQIACAIAVAEEELHFEHRDLHWGNVLVQVTTQEYSNFVLKGKEIAVNNKDLKATIIDFTLSRIEYEGVVIFNDLALDNDLFTATGDYQFEVYRLMQKNNGNEWLTFKPYSNVLWLHYILDKAITVFRYKNSRSKLHKTSLNKLREYKERILEYRSATEFVMNDFVE